MMTVKSVQREPSASSDAQRQKHRERQRRYYAKVRGRILQQRKQQRAALRVAEEAEDECPA